MPYKVPPQNGPSTIEPQDVELLRAIVEGTATATGEEFFRLLVENLAKAVGTGHAFVTEFTPPLRIRTLAYWENGGLIDNIEYDLPGTPCQEVIDGGFCFYPTGVAEKYAESTPGIDSFLGVPLTTIDGRILGHLVAMDAAPLPNEPRRLAVFQIFAARAAAELDRLRLERDLRDREQRLSDLFDEAPIAYVHETLDSRFIRANRAARRILGITSEEVPLIVGTQLSPDAPDAQRRIRAAYDSVGKGTDTSGVVLELRRKDNGKPIWVQWWSNPDVSGMYTRTMISNITERVQMEQDINLASSDLKTQG